jgi:hypothetical protein
LGGEAIGEVADDLINAENLLYHDNGRTRAGGRQGEIGLHRAIIGLDRDLAHERDSL